MVLRNYLRNYPKSSSTPGPDEMIDSRLQADVMDGAWGKSEYISPVGGI